jgi:spore coat protein H
MSFIQTLINIEISHQKAVKYFNFGKLLTSAICTMMKSIYMLMISFLLLSFLSAPLQASGQSSFPELRIYIKKSQYTDLQKTNTDKIVLSDPVMFVNNDTAVVKEIHARGNNSLKYKRKSLSVELNKAIDIENGNSIAHLKKFNLLNLSMDKHLWHNRWSNINLHSLDLFPLFNSYCTVWINDQHQGIYLLVEKPQQARNKVNSPYMLRRGPEHSISDEYFDEDDKEAAKKYRKQFQSIYSNIHSLQGDALAVQLQKILNLDAYFRFLAFNFLIMNGDYADEVFFYIEPQHDWFEVIPWDYDDILRFSPHEGRAARNKEHADKKIFSLEESLDRAIAGNETLYTHYEQTLKSLLLTLDSVSLTQSAHQVIDELEKISSDKVTSQSTLFMDKESFRMEEAKSDILLSLDLIIKRRKWILSELK